MTIPKKAAKQNLSDNRVDRRCAITTESALKHKEEIGRNKKSLSNEIIRQAHIADR